MDRSDHPWPSAQGETGEGRGWTADTDGDREPAARAACARHAEETSRCSSAQRQGSSPAIARVAGVGRARRKAAAGSAASCCSSRGGCSLAVGVLGPEPGAQRPSRTSSSCGTEAWKQQGYSFCLQRIR